MLRFLNARVGIALFALGFPALTMRAQQAEHPGLALSFLSGHWTGSSPESVEEEYWSPLLGDSMVGTFRVVRGGSAIFYEFWAIELEDGRPIFKMKHFNANLQGWEEKTDSVRLAVVESTATMVLFARADGTLSLRYERKGNTLLSTLHQVKDGKAHDELFTLERTD